MLYATALLQPMPRSIRSAFLFLGTLALAAGPATAQVAGYLNGAPLPYEVPPPPKAGPVVDMDMTLARALRAVPGSPEEDEAIGDAQAYLPPDIMVRFSNAAHLRLNPKTRPILLYMLSRALPEAGRYVRHWKEAYPRSRPYVVDSTIKPCYDRLVNPRESYPSGHAANGLAAAMVIAEVVPARRQALLARGIHYGNNRIVCGVHYQSDVYQGQLVAADYMAVLLRNAAFQADLECAQAEQRRAEQEDARKPLEALPVRCETLHL